MRLEHLTGMEAGYTMGLRPDGRELLVVCIKGTYTISQNSKMLKLAEKQVPLTEADVFTGEPGYSAPLYESDYAPFKPKCDVLLNGSAYSPKGKRIKNTAVSLQIGKFSKKMNVIGHRVWKKGITGFQASSPEPFEIMPIRYDSAFGGVDANHKDPEKLKTFLENPVGVGFHCHLDTKFVDGKPLPNTEEIGKTITKPDGNYRPMSFGSIGRSWQQRASLAGTYDKNWTDNIFPFLPPDFKEAYYQAAPADQQIPYPAGGEPVILTNLTPEGETEFYLPRINLLVWFFMKNGEEIEKKAISDTILIEPDQKRLMITSRVYLPLKKNMFEVEMAVIGQKPEDKTIRKDEEA